jgi:hypothetical protein
VAAPSSVPAPTAAITVKRLIDMLTPAP